MKELKNNNLWLKNNFYFHVSFVLKRLNIESEEIKRELWRVVRNTHQYAYAKGYRTGYERGLIKYGERNKD